jgi:hypothetical protein
MSTTGLAFLAAYFVGLLLAFFRDPRYGLYVYLAVFYLHPPSRWWGASLPGVRWALVASVVTLIALLVTSSRSTRKKRRDAEPAPPARPPWYSTTPAKILIVFTIWMWIQNMWALSPEDQLEATVLFTKYLVLFAVMYRLCETPEDVRDLLLIHLLGCGYLGWLTLSMPGSGRLEGVGGPGIDDANALGMFVATGIAAGAMLILVERGWRQWLAILAMPLVLNTLVQSESRGAMVGLLLAAVVLYYLKPQRYVKVFYLFAALAVMGFGYVANDAFWERMESLKAPVQENQEIDSSAESRIVLAVAQLEMAAAYPHGTGHRGTAVLSPDYLDEKWLTRSSATGPAARSSHNTFLSALVEQGIPGFVMFMWLVLWTVGRIFSLRRHRRSSDESDARLMAMASGAAAALIVVFVAGNFTDYIKTEVQIWMYALLAVSMTMLDTRATESAPAENALVPAPTRRRGRASARALRHRA